MRMNDDQGWWYCIKHHAVEHGAGCPGKDRLGPYRSKEEAEHALDTVRKRNEEWDAADGEPAP
jgi:hypothetical protein